MKAGLDYFSAGAVRWMKTSNYWRV